MWKREMKVLLSVCDYIQEFAPTAQYLEDGTIVEVRFVYRLVYSPSPGLNPDPLCHLIFSMLKLKPVELNNN